MTQCSNAAGNLATIAVALLIVSGCTAASAPLPGLQGLADTRYHRIESDATGHAYHVHVRLPHGHDPARRLPAVYLLDGGAMYPKLSGYYHYLRLGEELPPLALVGISYGSDRFEEGNFRSSDFTAPSPERDFWGGAGDFERFLADELLPRLENRYPFDPACRVLFGQSLGGQFVLYSAMSRPALFRGRIASNPALHRNLDYFLENVPPPTRPRARVFVALGENDADVFRVPAERWVEHWTAEPPAAWDLEAVVLDGQSHVSAAPSAFRQGLTWFFGTDPCVGSAR